MKHVAPFSVVISDLVKTTVHVLFNRHSQLHLLVLLKNGSKTNILPSKHVPPTAWCLTHHWLLHGVGLDIPSKLLGAKLVNVSFLEHKNILLSTSDTDKHWAFF